MVSWFYISVSKSHLLPLENKAQRMIPYNKNSRSVKKPNGINFDSKLLYPEN